MPVVLTDLHEGVRTITLNRPDRMNAMNGDLLAAVAGAFADANMDDATRAIVFTGAGAAFCAGDDLKDHRQPETRAEAEALVKVLQDCTRHMVLGEKVVVGAINGWAVGGGFEWAINCDLPIWSEQARAFFPEMDWGLFVTGAVTALLPAIVGLVKAREMLMLGEKYDAWALHEAGVAWRVVPPDRLLPAAQDVAARLAAKPQATLRDLKRVTNEAAFAGIERALERETEACVRSFLDPETTARVRHFTS
ncbi:MAG: enoyl-CoA hydratase/isomerase family protein [Hyphomicrobiales bacterium]|nr:enoyl-CoA hydratase/isomerase family protein [Hyphomicrobiales bacterium]MCP5372972.1 enoyl-CoA hydratase/isomerase family protein [Hyphomicrobiales bacterium]